MYMSCFSSIRISFILSIMIKRAHGHLVIIMGIPTPQSIGRIRLSVSTVNPTYELSGITHVTSFRKYGKHSTGPSTYGPCVRTYSKLFSCKPVLTVCSYRAQSNEIHTYGRVSRGSIPRVCRYGLLYLRTVEYDQCLYFEMGSYVSFSFIPFRVFLWRTCRDYKIQ